MKKIIYFTLMFIVMLQLNPLAITLTDPIEIQFNNYVSTIKNELYEETEKLLNLLTTELNVEEQQKLLTNIVANLTFHSAEIKLLNYTTYEDKVRLTVDIHHQYNIQNYMDYKTRLSAKEEACINSNEEVPCNLKIQCFKETLALCKNDTSSFQLEINGTLENDVLTFSPETLNPSGTFGFLKSLLF